MGNWHRFSVGGGSVTASAIGNHGYKLDLVSSGCGYCLVTVIWKEAAMKSNSPMRME